jgi:hypothetical protein
MFGFEISAALPYRDMIPGQGRKGRGDGVEDRFDVDIQFGKGLLPALDIEMFAPGVEAGTAAEDVFDGFAQAAVAAAKDAFEHRRFHVVALDFDALQSSLPP